MKKKHNVVCDVRSAHLIKVHNGIHGENNFKCLECNSKIETTESKEYYITSEGFLFHMECFEKNVEEHQKFKNKNFKGLRCAKCDKIFSKTEKRLVSDGEFYHFGCLTMSLAHEWMLS